MTDNNNVDIFICAHKDFKEFPNNPVYKIIHGKEKINIPLEQYTETTTDLSPMQFSLAEGSRIYWLLKNYEPKDYIGICHYRKYFKFYDNVPNIDCIFKDHDVITTEPLTHISIANGYAISHRFRDLQDMANIACRLYPEWAKEFVKALNGNILYSCNMFVMRKNDFKDYGDKAFSILKGFCNERGWNTDEGIKKYVEEHRNEYVKNIYPGNTTEYQQRILGFLLERITSAYISTMFKNPYTVEMITTEDKYKGKEGEKYFK